MPEITLHFASDSGAELFLTQLSQVRHALNSSEPDALRIIMSVGSRFILLSPATVTAAIKDLKDL